jgi:23S rRNA pseudouridine1911/1915/1917 synthase
MAPEKLLFVKEKHNGWRLDRFLVATGVFAERVRAQMAIREGAVRSGNVPFSKPSAIVKSGMAVSVRLATGTEAAPPKFDPSLAPHILAAQQDFLVLAKPAGLSMHPVGSVRRGNTLAEWVLSAFPEVARVGDNPMRPGLVHRLDRDTAGIVLVARTQRAFAGLKKLFQDRKVEKTYAALVYGHLPAPSGTISLPLGRVRGSIRRGTLVGKRRFGGETREAVTEYELRTRYPQHEFLSIKPKTGRTHQIRVHLAALGHPVVGDRLYGFKTHRRDLLRPPFQLLHAERIAFSWKGKKYAYVAPPPPHLTEALRTLDGLGRTR